MGAQQAANTNEFFYETNFGLLLFCFAFFTICLNVNATRLLNVMSNSNASLRDMLPQRVCDYMCWSALVHMRMAAADINWKHKPISSRKTHSFVVLANAILSVALRVSAMRISRHATHTHTRTQSIGAYEWWPTTVGKCYTKPL